MRDVISDTRMTLARLDALLASGSLSKTDAAACIDLGSALRRPARVAILGPAATDVSDVMSSLAGERIADLLPDGPALELVFGDHIRFEATFEDGSSLSQDGAPTPDLMQYGPVFLHVEAPAPRLETMSFLAVELDTDADAWSPALAWAAKRCEIAVFCVDRFEATAAAVWSAAPPRLKNHCYLVVTGDRAAANAASAEGRGLFDAVIHAPDLAHSAAPLEALTHRLEADIRLGRQEDVDAAELFLHRFRSVVPVPAREATTAGASDRAAGAAETGAKSHGADADAAAISAWRSMVSAPMLHLRARSRALAEILEWREPDENWSAEVLDHCCETTETLRDLASGWPDDDPVAERLRDAIDRACDTVVLLQVESGPEQAGDAARVLYQLRTDFEQSMAA